MLKGMRSEWESNIAECKKSMRDRHDAYRNQSMQKKG